LLVKLSPFADNPTLRSLDQLLVLLSLPAAAFLIAAVVHQDAIPGSRQDWLVRPIRRRDLLLAKFLFVLIAVHAPMFLADVLRGLGNGFAIGPSFTAALSRGLFVLLTFSMPLFAFSSLSRNLMEAIAASLAAFLCFAGFEIVLQQITTQNLLTDAGGSVWVSEAATILVGLVGAIAVLGLQYFRRRTVAARGLAAGTAVLALLVVTFLPSNVAFAVQQRMSPNPGAASTVSASFAPAMGRSRQSFIGRGTSGDFANVYLPIEFENLPASSALIVDRADVRLREENGVSTEAGFARSLVLRQETNGAKQVAYLLLIIPGDLYRRIEDRPSQLDIGLALTLFRSGGELHIQALNGKARFPDWGNCMTKLNSAETAVRLGCVPLEKAPSCFALRLKNFRDGVSNPPLFQCQGDYTPYFD
jgi:hypothetical protein